MKISKIFILVFILFFLVACGDFSEDDSENSEDNSTNSEDNATNSEDNSSSNDDSSSDSDNSDTTLPSIELIGSLNQTTDYSGDLIILGEVKNTGSTATFAEAKCNLFDMNSNLLETETTYIVGTVVKLKNSGINTNTALKQNDVGVFKAWTDTPASNVNSYECSYTFSTNDVEETQAKLEITGNVNQQSDSLGELELLGSVINSGTKGLTFGEVIFAIKNSAGNLLDIESTYIDGETVQLSSGSTTDTALSPGGTGTFDARTDVVFSSFNSYDSYFDWTDAIIQNGIVTGRNLRKYETKGKELWRERDKRISRLRNQLNKK